MPLNPKMDGPVKYAKDKETICLTKDEARHIYKKVELVGIVKVQIRLLFGICSPMPYS